MVDYTEDQLMQALRRADAAGDTEAATAIARRIQQMRSQTAPEAGSGERERVNVSRGEGESLPDYRARVVELIKDGKRPIAQVSETVSERQDEIADDLGTRTFGESVFDNIVGRDDGLTSPGEQIGRMVQSTGAGAARGVEALMNAPTDLTRGLVGLLGGNEQQQDIGAWVMDTVMPGSQEDLPGAVTDFDAQNRAEEYAGTVGEFLPGAVLGPGGMGRNAVQYGVLPGLASAAAGEATEGTSAEPYARVGAALLAPAVMARRVPTAQMAGRDASRVASANRLQQSGVTPSAGQATGSDMLRRMEGMVEPTSRQLDDFTAAAMSRIGSKAPKATPDALRAAQSQIVKRMDDALSGVSIRVPQQVTQQVDDVMRGYNRHITAGNRSNVFENIAEEIADFSRKPDQPVPASLLATWRSDLGKLSASADDATRDAAHGFRRIIDDLTDDALRQAGREADIPALASARNDYRNFLAVQDAATRAGAEGGSISPTALNQAVIRTQGRANYATGRGTDLADLSRSGAEVLRPMPTVNPGGLRGLEGGVPLTGAGIGYALSGGSPTGAVAGAAIPFGARALLRTPAMQNMIANPGAAARSLPALSSGLLADQNRRETGR